MADCHAECEAGMTIAIFAFTGVWNSGGQFTYSENLKQMQNVFSNGGFGRRHCPGGRRRPGRCC